VHDTFEQGRAGEQKHLPILLLLLAASILLVAASFYSSCMDLPMSTLWPARQCCRGAEISAANLLTFMSKFYVGPNFFRQQQKAFVDLAESFHN
jgi:hypothetical protein